MGTCKSGKTEPVTAPETCSISELAAEFDISTRTIRFYEEKNLLSPRRTPGGQRVYSRGDRARLKLILRGKRFGHTLEEIAEMIGPASEAVDEAGQIRRTLVYAEHHVKEIDAQMAELKVFREEVLAIRKRLEDRLRWLEARGEP